MTEVSNNKKIKFNNVIERINSFLDSIYFPISLLAIQLLMYFLGLDIFNIALISLIISYCFIFKKNQNVLLVVFLFMATMISVKNSPGVGGPTNEVNGYYFRPEIYISAIIFAAIPVTIAIVNAIRNIVSKRIEIDASFIATIVLGISFLLNGIFNPPFNLLNLMYGLFMFFFIVVLYFAILPNIHINKENMKLLAYQVAIFTLLPIIEVVACYIRYTATGNNPFTRGNYVFVGWGNRNTVGMIMLVVLSIVFYAVKYETNKTLKAIFWILTVLSIGVVILTFSRQAYIGLLILISLYFFIMLVRAPKEKKKRRTIHLLTWLLGSISFLLVFQFSGIFDFVGFDINLSNRLPLWKKGIDAYISNPLFGQGFYFLGGDKIVRVESLIPLFTHNTIIEMFAACGLFGGMSYLMYRFITTYKIYHTMSKEKAYPVMACSIFLIISIVDIHVFDLLGSAIYVTLFAMSMSKNNKSIKIV